MKTAPGGAAALEILQRDSQIAVVISDMRMPQMDGATFLTKARELVPDAVRVLLTGQADVESAIAAVNGGQIFRFLTKPCPPPLLIAALDAALEQHRLVTAERVLLEQTVLGSIKALSDVLALASPVSFGRATRIKQHVTDIASRLGVRERWQVEVAAMVSQLGCVTLPGETVEKLHYGQRLSDAEQKMVARVPTVTEQLLANIPRLEVVRAILAGSSRPFRRGDLVEGDAAKRHVERCAQILFVATDFASLEAVGSAAIAIDTMRGRGDRYDPEVLGALAAIRGSMGDDVRELPVSALRAGMVFAEDVKSSGGTLLVPRGFEVTAGFIERARNFRPGTLREPLRVVVPGTRSPS